VQDELSHAPEKVDDSQSARDGYDGIHQAFDGRQKAGSSGEHGGGERNDRSQNGEREKCGVKFFHVVLFCKIIKTKTIYSGKSELFWFGAPLPKFNSPEAMPMMALYEIKMKIARTPHIMYSLPCFIVLLSAPMTYLDKPQKKKMKAMAKSIGMRRLIRLMT